MANFIKHMQKVNLPDSPKAERGMPLIARDEATRKAKITVPILSEPPNVDWRSRAEEIVKQAQLNLWSEWGKRALAYLKEQRGLTETFIREARLGCIPGDYRERHS